MLSQKIAIAAISAGVLTAIFSSAIDFFFETVVTKKYKLNFRQIINRFLLQACFLGWLIGIIFYAFAYTDAAPIRKIITYSIIIGVVAPSLSKLLVLVYPKLFSKKESD